ncbi:MAG: hypothetical protein EB829_00235 [Nitrosopumilus sp. H8]|nr:MAG: hypothetical protein EB829_00235 [Nitrosopumilus sp. H8]
MAVDIASKKLPAIIIVILIGVLIVQFAANNPDMERFVDEQTCEIYAVDSRVGGKQYLGEFDPVCMELNAP